MPNIREFNLTPQQSELHPTEEGPSAFERVGRSEMIAGEVAGSALRGGITAIGKTVAEAGNVWQNHQTQQDILNGALAHTQLAAKTAEELPQVLASSDDPVQAVKDYYQNTYSPAAEKIVGSMSTDKSRMWAAEHTASQSQAFFQHGMSEAMNIQGARSVAKFQGATDNLAVAAHANPEGFETYIQQADSVMDAIKGQLSPQQQAAFEEHRANVHSQLALAAGHALADQNPQQFKADLDKGWGADHLNAEQRQQLSQYTNYAQRQQDMDQRRTSQEHVSDWVSNLYTDDGRIKQITPAMIGQLHSDPSIRPQDQRSAVNLGVSLFKQQQKEDEGTLEARAMKTNPAVAADFIMRVGDPENPLTKDQIAEKVREGRLSVAQGIEFANKIAPKNVDALAKLNNSPLVKTELDRAGAIIRGNVDPGNQAVRDKTDQFHLDTLRTLQDAQMRGENVQEYLDPKNPKYLFDPAKIKQYAPTKKEIANQVVARPVAPKPGETPAAPAARPPLADVLSKAFQGMLQHKPAENQSQKDQKFIQGGGT